MVEWEPLSSPGSPPDRNHVPQLRDRKGHVRARREAAPRAALDAGWRPGRPPDPRDLWDPVGADGHPTEPVSHRHDGGSRQRRARRGPVGVRGDYAKEPDERSHRGGRDQHHPDLLRRAARPDRRHRRDSRRNSRGGEAGPPPGPPRRGHHSRPNPSQPPPRGPSPFFLFLSFSNLPPGTPSPTSPP